MNEISIGWAKWAQASGVFYDCQVHSDSRGFFIDLLLDLLCCMELNIGQILTEKLEVHLVVVRMMMWMRGVPRKGRIRNAYIRGNI